MYAFQHEGRTFTPDGVAPQIVDTEAHNTAVEAAELAEWAKQPERFAAYARRNTITTWRGVEIGRVVWSSMYRNPLTGSWMRAVRVKGTNGATYSGRYGSDWSQLVRLRRTKG